MTTPNARELQLARETAYAVGHALSYEWEGIVALALASYRDEMLGDAQQACRYALKYQNFGSDTDPEFKSGWVVAVDVCQHAINRLSQPKGGTSAAPQKEGEDVE